MSEAMCFRWQSVYQPGSLNDSVEQSCHLYFSLPHAVVSVLHKKDIYLNLNLVIEILGVICCSS